MAADRFIALTWPLQAAVICTMKKARIATAIVLAIALVYGGVHAFPKKYYPELNIWICPYNFVYRYDVLFGTMVNVQSFYIPIVALLSLNIGIVVAVQRSKKFRANQRSTNPESSKEGVITRMIIIITSAFIIFSLPLRIHSGFWSAWESEITIRIFMVRKLSLSLGIAVNIANYGLNSYMYVLACKRYRKELYILLKNICHKTEKETKTLSNRTC
jgi:preprotein translocase subunit SecG